MAEAEGKHARGLMRIYTNMKIDYDRDGGPEMETNRQKVEPQLSALLRQSPQRAAQTALLSDATTLSGLDGPEVHMVNLTRASVSARALRLAKLLDETGYDVQASPQERWDALVKASAHLTAWKDWPPS